MPRYLTVEEVILLHQDAIDDAGGLHGIRDLGTLVSCVDLPSGGFGEHEFYPTLWEKAAALGFALIRNHPFIDGNKRAAMQAMDAFLALNGFELTGDAPAQHRFILALTAGELGRDELREWLEEHSRPLADEPPA